MKNDFQYADGKHKISRFSSKLALDHFKDMLYIKTRIIKERKIQDTYDDWEIEYMNPISIFREV